MSDAVERLCREIITCINKRSRDERVERKLVQILVDYLGKIGDDIWEG